MIIRRYFSTRRPRWLAAAVAVPLLGALTLSACSSSSSSSSSSTGASASSGTGSASAAASGATGSPIVIGSIGTYTGPLVGNSTVTEQIFQTWASYTNANGGINGHPVKVISYDDGGSPATAITDINKLVNAHILALVGMETTTYPQWAPILTKAGIPVVGGLAFAAEFFTNPQWFPVAGAGPSTAYVELKIAADQGKKHLGVLYCSESPDCARASQQENATVKQYSSSLGGMTFAYSAGVSATAPSYASQCLAAKQAGVDTMFYAVASATVLRVQKDCQSQGLTLLPLASSQTADPTWATPGSPAEGAISANGTFPWTADDTAAAKAFQGAINQYDPSFKTTVGYSDAASEIWTSLQLFKTAAEAGKISANPTPAEVISGFYALPKNDTLGGLASTLNYNKGKPNPPVQCGFVTELQNDKFTAPQGSKLICPPTT
jgi:branched-chain amino acid transport system substrate-binding protein